MHFTKFFILITLLFLSGFGREKKIVLGEISGTVIDDRTETSIINAIVEIKSLGLKDTTDSLGQFSLKDIQANFYDFDISAKGYENKYSPSVIIKSGINKEITFALQKSNIKMLDKMFISSSKINYKKPDQTTSVIKLTRDEINNSPGALQDVNEVLKILPSAIGSGDDWDNSLHVRGGSEDENIYLIDGMEVTNISHWGSENSSGGAISSFHPDFIDHLDFYAGGFPAYAPPRLSSVTEMNLRNGSMEDHSFQIDLNMAGLGLFLEGPIIKNKLSYIVSGRVSFLNLIEPLINTGGLPKYQNGQLKLAYNMNKSNSFFINLLAMHDEIAAKNDEEEYKEDNTRVIGGIGWDLKTDNFSNRLLFSGSYANSNFFYLIDSSRVKSEDYKDTREKFQLKNYSSLYLRENDILNFGLDLEFQDYNEFFQNDRYYVYNDSIGEYQTSKDTPNLNNVLDNDTNYIFTIDHYKEDTTLAGNRFGGYASYTLGLGNVKINAGLRDDYYTVLDKNALSPRLSTSINLDKAGSFSVSSGLFYQFPTNFRILSMKNFINKIELQRNWQVALGYEKQLGKNVIIGSEIYYKLYDREPLYDIVDQEREIDTLFNKHGEKRVYGIEFYAQKKKIDKFYYNISYTLLNSEMKYKNGNWYTDDFNLRNNATIVLGSKFHKNHGVCIRADLSEGYPYTPIDMENSDIETKYDVSDGWNSERRDFRAKLGLRYDLRLFLRKMNVTLYLEVKNLLNQSDVVFEHYDPKDGGKIIQYEGMGILPIGGLTIDF